MIETRANGSFHKRLVNDRTLTILKNKLKATSWDDVVSQDDTNKSCSIFINTFDAVFISTIPLRQIKSECKCSKKPWITSEHSGYDKEKGHIL